MKNCANFLMLENEKVRQELEEHALTTPDREVCGFVYKDFYFPLQNLAKDDHSFYADPANVAYALAHYGEPLAIFHTHPNGFTLPSSTDVSISYYIDSTTIIGTLREGRLSLSYF